MTNEERGLVKHTDPDNPTGPLLDYRPDLSGRTKPAETQAKKPPQRKAGNRKKVTRKKRS